MTTDEFLLAVASIHTAAILALAVYIVRTRDEITRLREWARWIEKRINGS